MVAASSGLGDIMGGSATRNNSSLPPLDEFTRCSV